MAFMLAAYGVIIVALLGYVLRLWLMERSYRRQMETLLGSESPR